jgi:hypothetical protein
VSGDLVKDGVPTTPVEAYARGIEREAADTNRNSYPPPGAKAEHKEKRDTRNLLDEVEYERFNRTAADSVFAGMTQPADPKKLWGEKKLNVGAVPPTAILAMARGLGEGVDKYGAFNWRSDLGVETLTYYKGTLRHLFAWLDGEDVDPDSKTGKTHLEGAISSLAILIDAIESGYAIDNRPRKGGSPRMLLSGAREVK